jgi:HSP20 family molecular chaperone IbpA
MSTSYESSSKSVYYVKELRQSAFKRTLALPSYAKEEPDAILEDGILTLKWKQPEKLKIPEPKKISIKQIKD